MDVTDATDEIEASEGRAAGCRISFGATVRRGVLERRYKRFFADVVLDGPEGLVTAHTPNTGAMTGLLERGSPVLVTHDPSPKRTLHWTLQAICAQGAWVGCNTLLPNRLVARAVELGLLRELRGYRRVRREVPYGRDGRSRVDLLLEDHARGRPDCLVEVKSVTLRDGARALFPDAVSERGRKHLEELTREVEAGRRAAMVYVVQRMDCASFAPAAAIDPAYADALVEARSAGVEVIAFLGRVDDEGVAWAGRLPVRLPRRRP